MSTNQFRRPLLQSAGILVAVIVLASIAASSGDANSGGFLGLIVGAIGHFAAVWAAKRDPLFVDVGRRHLRIPAHLTV